MTSMLIENDLPMQVELKSGQSIFFSLLSDEFVSSHLGNHTYFKCEF